MKTEMEFGITGDKLWIGWTTTDEESTHRHYYRLDKIIGVHVHTHRKLVNVAEVPLGAPRDPNAKTQWIDIHDVTLTILGDDIGATIQFTDAAHASNFVGVCLGDSDTIDEVIPNLPKPKKGN